MGLPGALLLCALPLAALAGHAGDYELLYVDLDNEIDHGLPPSAPPTPCDCGREPSAWDKLFTMLEDSQMRQSMLLQTTEHVARAELPRLRAELARLAGRLGPADAALPGALAELLQASRDAERRLARLEAAGALGAVLAELRAARADLRALQAPAARRRLPAGCETAILFPTRSRKTFGSVHPAAPLKLEAFSACLWVKATDVLDRTVLFSYGTQRSPRELQLYLGAGTLVLLVGGEQGQLRAETHVAPGAWSHVCSSWSSLRGQGALWVNGALAASAVDLAPGHVVPEGGLLQLGHGKDGGSGEGLAFAGWLTGFDLWDRVLSQEEIRAAGGPEACRAQGNVVSWGVTEIQLHGGAQYVA
ncbi:pentraxin-related protein PTX3 [Sorex araneus]|uniref:pentraxin-related protein PTX3 n=1 Tax=Sorex araneus TaxID=42254 RepID=UPI002433E408|nr:pentraxin-related protein PTX3 [Sorex araneus]